MDIRPIKTEADYEAALQKIDQLMDAELGTPEGDQLDVLVILVEAYEARHYSIADPDCGHCPPYGSPELDSQGSGAHAGEAGPGYRNFSAPAPAYPQHDS